VEKRSLETREILKALCCAALVTAAAVSLTRRLAVRSGAVREPSVAESAQTVGWRFTEGGAGGGRYVSLNWTIFDTTILGQRFAQGS